MISNRFIIKTFFIVALLSTISSNTFSLKSLSPYTLLDNNLCKYWGNEEASLIYQEKIRVFLEHLGIKDPKTISIRKFNEQTASWHPNTYAIARPTGIWINEYMLPPEDSLTSLQLFVLAHEVSHFALQHKRLIILLTILNSYPYLPVIGVIANMLTNVFFLYKLSEWVAKDPAWIKTQSFANSISLLALTNTLLASLKEIIAPLTAQSSRRLEKEADLGAAKILCELGYAYVVEDRIQQCQEDLEKGLNADIMHPAFEEEIKYLSELLETWNKEQMLAEEKSET